jgi:hypothetical protein
VKSSHRKIIFTLALIGLFCAQHTQAQDHGHLRIGARGTTQGSPLYFYNGADFASTSGYVKTLIFTNGGTYAGYHQGNVTLTVQAATASFAGPEPDAPALGSYVRAMIVSIKGPAGGAFGFWDAGATNPTISVFSVEMGTNSFNVTQTDGSPGADPFGHVHGRRLTATKPGIYTVSFRAFDTSTNGVNGGPIHTPSEIIEVSFQAGISIASIAKTNNNSTITFGSVANQNFWLESSTNLSNPTGWIAVAGPLVGNDYFQSLTETNTSDHPMRLFRIKADAP